MDLLGLAPSFSPIESAERLAEIPPPIMSVLGLCGNLARISWPRASSPNDCKTFLVKNVTDSDSLHYIDKFPETFVVVFVFHVPARDQGRIVRHVCEFRQHDRVFRCLVSQRRDVACARSLDI